jgi:phosphatidylserine decarboxylase
MKKTHKFGNVKELLKDSIYRDSFGGGTFAHYFLGPYSYHRFHSPVSGMVKECFSVKGMTYVDVEIKNNQFSAPDSSKNGYEFNQTRGIFTIDTKDSEYGNVGVVAVIPVGMSQVSSVNMIAQANNELLKGDEIGYFAFGGSDIIMLFQEGSNPKIDDIKKLHHFGSQIAKSNLL